MVFPSAAKGSKKTVQKSTSAASMVASTSDASMVASTSADIMYYQNRSNTSKIAFAKANALAALASAAVAEANAEIARAKANEEIARAKEKVALANADIAKVEANSDDSILSYIMSRSLTDSKNQSTPPMKHLEDMHEYSDNDLYISFISTESESTRIYDREPIKNILNPRKLSPFNDPLDITPP